MTIFTNRIAGAKEEADAYTQAILELLGDREPREVLERSPRSFAKAFEGMTPDEIRAPEAPGKWSALEVLQHLADSELVWSLRLRSVVVENRAPITGYDQDLWAERLRYRDQSPEDALELFRVLRAANLRLLGSLSADELRRVGIHSERGEESIEHMVRLYAGHDLVHRRQLERIRNRLREPRGAADA